jgi:hypothetical protein
MGGPTARERQAVLDQVNQQLTDLKIPQQEYRAIVRPYVQMIGFDFYTIYVRLFDRYFSWKQSELLRQYNSTQSPESKQALDRFRDKPGRWRSRALGREIWDNLNSERLSDELTKASPDDWLEPHEKKAADAFRAELVRLFKACEEKGGYTDEAADYYDKYHDLAGQDRKIQDMFGINPSEVR